MTTYELNDAELEASVSRMVSRVRTAEDWEIERQHTRLDIAAYLADRERAEAQEPSEDEWLWSQGWIE